MGRNCQFKQYSAEDETELINSYKSGDPDAKDSLIKAHRKLHENIAKRYTRPHIETSDLAQEGFFGFSEAVNKFDPSRGTRLSTYEYKAVRNRILDYAKKNASNDVTSLDDPENMMFFMKNPRHVQHNQEKTAIGESMKMLLDRLLYGMNNAKYARILRMKYGINRDDAMTEQQIADIFNTTKGGVHQQLIKSMKNLQMLINIPKRKLRNPYLDQIFSQYYSSNGDVAIAAKNLECPEEDIAAYWRRAGFEFSGN